VLESRDDNKVIINNTECINFCSNDYLGLATNSEVKKAFIDGVNEYGFGSGSSALVSGYFKPQKILEEKFAAFLGRGKAIIFNSGYHANLGVISTLAQRNDIILSDKLCHASLLDGIQLSRAEHHRYQHNDLEHLEEKLKSVGKNCFIITESVFSMEGDIAPMNEIAKLSKQYNAALIVDDAHGFGVLGKKGRGIIEHSQLNEDAISCLVTPLGKAIGSLGAVVSGDNEVIEAILQFARTYRYTTALPPAITVATLKSLEIMEKEEWRIEQLNKLINFFILQSHHRNLPLISDEITPIKSFLIGDNSLTLKIQKILLENGFYVSCIRPPTVPQNTARIRVTLNSNHHEQQIIDLLDLMAEYYETAK